MAKKPKPKRPTPAELRAGERRVEPEMDYFGFGGTYRQPPMRRHRGPLTVGGISTGTKGSARRSR